MCGRFTLILDPNQLRQDFAWLNIPVDTAPRYNIAPNQPVAVVPNDGQKRLDYYLWGLIPFWAKDPKIGSRMINARSETAAKKPAFRAAFRRRRCLIPADGFYEWQKYPSENRKTPIYIRLTSGKPFTFAGLWDSWDSEDGSNILSCTILTTRPNELLEPIHNRMPVILPAKAYQLWLDPGEPSLEKLQSVLKPYPADQMTAYPVSTLVNNPANDLAACISPVN